MSGVSTLAVSAAGAGALLLWSGVTGAGVLSNLKGLLHGGKPSSANANPIGTPASDSTGAVDTSGSVTGGTGTAGGIVAIAHAQLGQGQTKYVSWYGGGSGEWCDVFVSWCSAQNNSAAATGGKYALTTAHALWFYAHGLWHSGADGMSAGDIVFFGTPGSIPSIYHVAIGTGGAGNETIAGNTGGHDVAVEHWSAGQIAGYGRPVYPGTAPTTSPKTRFAQSGA